MTATMAIPAEVPNGLSLIKLDLGCGPNKKPDWVGIDRIPFPGVDYVMDLGHTPWPFDAGSVGEAFSSHCVEHLTPEERCFFFNELHRVMAFGAVAKIITPHWSTNRAYGDPTHQWPPIGEFFYMYLCRDWRLGNPEKNIGRNAPHTDKAFWPQGYECDFELVCYEHGINKAYANRPVKFREMAAEHYREFVFDLIVTLTKR